jgi:hypothetical protein
MIRFASNSAISKLRKLKRRNLSTLCRYFSLIYPREYVEGVAGGRCPRG